ncbi:hypothetical protein [Candidatus Thiothrix anitrata]|jgi:hypothetical protein|uniref:Type II secretion system protein GspC N-terminal domain-containing protein n=1 Tax=Candidatus Thiothrix anitrata TaxID=2823902 RepID=A0ABX7X8H4_9GAMM|nr:hypothetical protein [Candidatus Thiothrix anitrata]QTR51524.1 hypothetical protein J8380_08295 [Candidatus Thiothrix anitrata]
MRKLINPPIQALLLMSGVGLLGLAGWSLVDLKLRDESQAHAGGEVSVKIPDASVLDAPAMDAYPQMVQTPLFWETRKKPEAPKQAAPVVEVVPVDTSLPEGRLIGIINLGDSSFGIVQDSEGQSTHLRKGDSWGAWKVIGLNSERLQLAQGSEVQEIPLIGDFAVPQENPQVAQAKARVLQQQAAIKRPVQGITPAAQIAMAGKQQPVAVPPPLVSPPIDPVMDNAMPGNNGMGLPFPADTAKQPPALSVKDALEARQRLMASRWGSLSGDAAMPTESGQKQ